MSAVGEARLRLYSGLSRCACPQRRLWWRSTSSRRNTTLSLALPYSSSSSSSTSTSTSLSTSSSRLPRILQPSLWKSALPTFLLSRVTRQENQAKKPWNPATFFLAMSILIGSQAINTIALRNERDVFMRRADQRILALKEVVKKVNEGEWQADGPEVERTLRRGLNDEPLTEEDWENTLKEIEEEEIEWQTAAKKRRGVWEQDHYEKGLKEEKKRNQRAEREAGEEAEKRRALPYDPEPRPDYRTSPRKHGDRDGEKKPPPPSSGPQSAKDYFS